MDKHTPGPWEIEILAQDGSFTGDILTSYGEIIAEVAWLSNREDKTESESNIRLVCQAPALLAVYEAAKELREYQRSLIDIDLVGDLIEKDVDWGKVSKLTFALDAALDAAGV